MKINPLPDIAASAGLAGATKAASGKPAVRGAQPEAGAGSSDPVTVTVSSGVRSFEPVSAGDGVDSAKVAEIRESIANGTYKVDAEAIAGKLLENAQEILSRVRQPS